MDTDWPRVECAEWCLEACCDCNVHVIMFRLRWLDKSFGPGDDTMKGAVLSCRTVPGCMLIIRSAKLPLQIMLPRAVQVAAVAGVRGVPATAGVLGGCSAIFSRKATRLSVNSLPQNGKD
jgi:hypothetical protein